MFNASEVCWWNPRRPSRVCWYIFSLKSEFAVRGRPAKSDEGDLVTAVERVFTGSRREPAGLSGAFNFQLQSVNVKLRL